MLEGHSDVEDRCQYLCTGRWYADLNIKTYSSMPVQDILLDILHWCGHHVTTNGYSCAKRTHCGIFDPAIAGNVCQYAPQVLHFGFSGPTPISQFGAAWKR